tara:strand:+ start:1735 stop:2088 length:354 start_codon:yes stop_codon:yes gene_type:complete
MATFPSIQPSYGVTKSSKPKTRTIRFADGYEHRIMFGIAEHNNPKEYSLTFSNLTEVQSDTIENFLDARALDRASFTFTPPNESSASQFVCEGWDKNMVFNNRNTITCTFREVFEPS